MTFVYWSLKENVLWKKSQQSQSAIQCQGNHNKLATQRSTPLSAWFEATRSLYTWTATLQPSQVTAHLPASHPLNSVFHTTGSGDTSFSFTFTFLFNVFV